MFAARILLAALIAVSTALLPIGCGAGQPSPPVASMAMAMNGGANAPCCPSDHAKPSPACAMQCGSIVAAGAPHVGWVPFQVAAKVMAEVRDLPLDGEVVRPPTHPPRA